ncbi:MAG: Gfo/Idh/MocA family oxidoreductase [Anaerolineales bacterium]|nr:Gfo/Idh/MocA family oxidoreductase [Anaerolineales bacterium]
MTPIRKTGVNAIVVGAGLMGRWHVAAIRSVGGQVLAIVDSDENRAAGLARHIKNARVYSRLEDALDHAQPEVVHICTPAPTHRELAIQALHSGAHLLIEKPLADTLGDTQYIFDLAEQRRLTVCPVHQFIFQDGIQRLHSWLPNAGAISQMTFVIRSAGGTTTSLTNLDLLVAEILPHPLSVMQDLLPGSLETRWLTSRPAPGELRILGTYIRNNSVGVGLTVEISLNARPTQNSMIVAAHKATYVADLFHGFAFRLPGAVSRAHKIIQPFEASLLQFQAAASNLTKRIINNESAYPGLRRLISRFYNYLTVGGVPPITAQDSLAVERARQVIMGSQN